MKTLKIGIIGLGYVGLTTALALSYKGHVVYGIEIDKRKLDNLNGRRLPFYEEMADEIFQQTFGSNFFVTDSLADVYDVVDVFFVCVNTPSAIDGAMDDKYLNNVITNIIDLMKSEKNEKYKLIVIKSTVVPGTTSKIAQRIEIESGKHLGVDFGVAMVPEFLRQSKAMYDSLNPSRIVCGVITEKDRDILEKIFKPFDSPKFYVSLETAEFVKYASNSFLALKISFANELANIINHFLERHPYSEVNVDKVVELMGYDPRINPRQMKAGIGFGGSCFPKDVKAFVTVARQLGYEPSLLPQILELNHRQPYQSVEYLKKTLGSLSGKKIAVLGLAFKPGTDDIRETPAIHVVRALLQEGAHIKAYDPKAMENFALLFPNLEYTSSIEHALMDIDGAILVTDWPEIVDHLNKLETRSFVLFDGRGAVLSADKSIGRKTYPNFREKDIKEDEAPIKIFN